MRVSLKKAFVTISAILCLSAAAQAAEEKVLNIYNWSDYIAPDTLEKFTAETGIRVNYDVYDSDEVVQAKLQAGRSGYDIVFPSAPFTAQQIQVGIHQKLNKDLIPNLANLDPVVMKTMSDITDPGNLYAVPYMIGPTNIGYNVDKVKALFPDVTFDDWDMIFDPRYMEKLKDCGVSFLDTPTEVFPAALVYRGLDGASQTSESLKIAMDTVINVRPYVRYFHSSKFINDLANGDICVAHGHGGDLIQARERAAEADNGVNIAIFIPKSGAVVNIDTAVIPKDAPHPENAHKFINFLLKPEIIAAISNATGYANAVPSSKPYLEDWIAEDPSVYPPEEIAAKEFQIPPSDLAYDRERTRTWIRAKTGR